MHKRQSIPHPPYQTSFITQKLNSNAGQKYGDLKNNKIGYVQD